jgi:hypothetical protein
MVDAPGPGAASVATELLAFYREPARFRPHFIHGTAPLPEGDVVLKFALGRFSPGWRRDLPQHDQAELIAAARAFVRQVCLWERATHYQLLCLHRTAGSDQVKENYRLLMALLHPDRQDGSAWPADAAQRINEAHDVLADDAARREYDATLQLAHVALPLDPAAMVHPRRRRRRSFVRPVVAVVAGAAALFLVQSWWVTDVPKHYTLLERALPLGASASWVRNVLPNDLPRFLDSKPAIAFDPIELLPPVKQPPRLASVSVWTPAASAAPVTTPPSLTVNASAAPLVPVRESRDAPVVREVAPRVQVAQATPVPAPPSAASPHPSTEDIEMLVARLVSFYEAGDTQGIIGLFDREQLGLWRGFRTRSAYSEFFRGTKDRRLRMDRLTWQTAPQAAQARGQATLTADNTDGGTRIERKVDVEIDIGVREGQARITRLVLFPDTP